MNSELCSGNGNCIYPKIDIHVAKGCCIYSKLDLAHSQFSFSFMASLAWQQNGGIGFVDGYQSIRSFHGKDASESLNGPRIGFRVDWSPC